MKLKHLLVLSLFFTSFLLGACGSQTYSWNNCPHLFSTPTDRSWLIVKCKFSDVPDVPSGLDDRISNFLAPGILGLGSMVDYFNDVSYGAISLTKNKVQQQAWYTVPDPLPTPIRPGDRFTTIVDCINQVPATFDFSPYYGVIAVVNKPCNCVGAGGIGSQPITIHGKQYKLATVLLDPNSLIVGFAGQELGHGFGLQHSYDTSQSNCGGAPGEYCDPWDMMSGSGIFSFSGNNFPASSPSDGPGMNVPNLLQLGWIPQNRIGMYHFGDPPTIVTLAALSHPTAQGLLTFKLIGSDPHDYYTVEYRQQDGWDTGIPRNTVLIHEYKEGQTLYSYLQRNTNSGGQRCLSAPKQCDFQPGMSWTDPSNKVTVDVLSIDASSGTAKVQIRNPQTFSTGPSVRIQSPANGIHVIVGQQFQLNAFATTADGNPLPDADVTWQANGAVIGTGKVLTTTLPTVGKYTITVTGTANSQSKSDSITLYADPPSGQPTVQILSPTSGTLYPFYQFGGSFSLSLSSQASGGVSSYAWSDTLGLVSDSKANDTLTITPPTSLDTCNMQSSDTITLTVTDSHGQTAKASVTIKIEYECNK